MDRTEILDRIVKGAEYLEREDITPTQRAKAKVRYDELNQQLVDLDKQEERRRNIDPRVERSIAEIREILKDAKPRKKMA